MGEHYEFRPPSGEGSPSTIEGDSGVHIDASDYCGGLGLPYLVLLKQAQGRLPGAVT